MSACRLYIADVADDRANARQSGKSMIFRTSTAGMNRDGCACLHAADGYAPCERASPASPGNRRFHGLLPERNMNVIFLRGLSLG